MNEKKLQGRVAVNDDGSPKLERRGAQLFVTLEVFLNQTDKIETVLETVEVDLSRHAAWNTESEIWGGNWYRVEHRLVGVEDAD